MGVETEYALSGRYKNGAPVERGLILGGLMDRVRETRPSLRCGGGGGGVFLATGGRFYMDCGHPEYATPECADPWTAARYVRAGDKILTELGASLASRLEGEPELSFFRFQVDYDVPGTTWGCHESYLNRSAPNVLSGALLPHLASRILYAGAGGFNPLSEGIQYTISPRAWLLKHDISSDSTGNRGIVNTREESLAAPGWRRLHLLCGESLGSDVATVLRLGTTALVVVAAERGSLPIDEVALASPLDALRTFAADPSCTKTAPLAGGGSASALDIQWTYLRAIEASRLAGELPSWAGELCSLWRRVLSDFEDDPESLSRSLDWRVKADLTDRWLDRRLSEAGLDRAWVRGWTAILDTLRNRLRRTPFDGWGVRALFEARGEPALSALKPAVREAVRLGIAVDTLPLFLEIRRQLHEIDVHVGEIGRGIFDQMAQRGLLSGQLFGEEEVNRATHGPPTEGRARHRGEAVREMAAKGSDGCWADWTRVLDGQTQRTLSLHDPWLDAPVWKSLKDTETPSLARLRAQTVLGAFS